ncbi:uncharacterized protein LOC143285087 [Babylonia areolata]|uniref:uncharacterized protein LOC143285087 n=1 Tax=Babylonia areolata TaxID=304850 RepID=UPI003FD128B5
MKERRVDHLLLFPLSFVFFLILSGALQASEPCRFQQGNTAVVAYCEHGCCATQCCSYEESDEAKLHTTILVVVSVIAGLIIVALIVVSIVRFVKDKKEDKEMELAERGRDIPAALRGRGFPSNGPPSSRRSPAANLKTASITSQIDQPSPPETARPKSAAKIDQSLPPPDRPESSISRGQSLPSPDRPESSISRGQSPPLPARPKTAIGRLLSVRPSDVSLHNEDINSLSLLSSLRLSHRRNSEYPAQERNSNHEDPYRRGSHPQVTPVAPPFLSGRRKKAWCLESEPEMSEHECGSSGGNSLFRSPASQILFVHREHPIPIHEQSQNESQIVRKNPESPRRRSLIPFTPQQSDPGVVAVTSQIRPSTGHHHRVRRGSELFERDEKTFFQHRYGNLRYTQTRHSDAFLEMKNETPISSILRTQSASRKRSTSVHFGHVHEMTGDEF